MSDRDRLLAAVRLPAASMLHFGANPCHSPARESQPRATCAECGGTANSGADPIRPYHAHVRVGGARRHEPGGAGRNRHAASAAVAEPLAVVCGGCGRSAYDGTAALARAVKSPLSAPEPPAAPLADGRVAEAVRRTPAARAKGGKMARKRHRRERMADRA